MGSIRATVMEGSFGNQKLHYGVGMIAARNRFSETLLLFFGIHMANAATLAARRLRAEEEEKEKAKKAKHRA
ncbi:MAG: transposase [Bacteroidales bacterium]|nr:transposase [Bacteroidales bacterium]